MQIRLQILDELPITYLAGSDNPAQEAGDICADLIRFLISCGICFDVVADTTTVFIKTHSLIGIEAAKTIFTNSIEAEKARQAFIKLAEQNQKES